MDHLSQTPALPRRRMKGRRGALWALGSVLLIVTLLLTPPLLNVNRLRRRIVGSMSESLGRPVHLDKVTLNVLPVPGFTLENLVVSEDPSFGAEPVIRANSVRATVRVSSLWRRQVEFSTIRFEEPSVNLVRRADGRWNLETILLHASQRDAAPTAQARAGSAPRFPYIEATGARLNVKLGDDKLPFSLTDADFALWLPSPQQWRVRLEGRPARTDTSVSDTGILSVEATLESAARLVDVPIELTAAWRRTPLGEATHFLTGSDAGWRGSVDLVASLRGTLGDAVLNANLKLGDLRRADFIPAKMLDLNMECTGHIATASAVLHEPTCTLSPTPINHIGFGAVAAPASAIYATADKVELTDLTATGVHVGTPGVALDWLLDFARLRSQRLPASEAPKGTARGSFIRTAATQGKPSSWQGRLDGTIQMASLDFPGSVPTNREFSVVSAGNGFNLAPFNFTYADKSPLILSATATESNLTLRWDGTGTLHQVSLLTRAMPPLGDGLDAALPTTPPRSQAPLKIDITCIRPWGGQQTCAAARTPEVPKHPRRRRP